jgi:hypothetical protein
LPDLGLKFFNFLSYQVIALLFINFQALGLHCQVLLLYFFDYLGFELLDFSSLSDSFVSEILEAFLPQFLVG